MEDWSNLCRSCLGSGSQYSLFGEIEEIRQKFIETTSIEPKPDDGLPPNICCECLILMNSAHHFRKQCQKIDAELKQQLLNIRLLTQRKKIKKEKKTGSDSNDEDDDFYYVLVIDSDQELEQQKAPEEKSDAVVLPIKEEPQELSLEPLGLTHLLNSTELFSGDNTSDLLDTSKLDQSNIPIDFDVDFDEVDIKQDVHNNEDIHLEPQIILSTNQDSINKESLVKLLDEKGLSEGTLLLREANGEFIKCLTTESGEEVIFCNSEDQFKFLNCDDGSELVIEYADESQVSTIIQQEDGTYLCDCGDILQNLENYNDHQMTHDAKTNKMHSFFGGEIENGEYQVCPFCQKVFTNGESYRMHCALHRKEFIKMLPENTLTKQQDQNEDENLRTLGYACTECGMIFTSHSALSEHAPTHSDTREAEVRRESVTHLCQICGAVMTSKRAVSLHMSTHETNKSNRFTCKICGKKCQSNAMLSMHERVHTNERPFSCARCFKRFKTKTHLRTHMLTHTQERKYGCSVCMKFFALKGNLVVHLRTHTGERPYVCVLCGVGFIDSKYLKNHKKKVHNIENLPWNEYTEDINDDLADG